MRAPLARSLADRGLAVLLLDYRGYGGNPGSPTEHGLGQDVRAARAFLVDVGVPPARILYYGESLGAAVVVALATEICGSSSTNTPITTTHRTLNQDPPAGRTNPFAEGANVRVLRRDRLGGLIHEYAQVA